ncbi:serine hydrolase domain-containing protein [Novosphingopyxis baekryungensis]|uniref:serine hydrolase domain-containing protein n=1 Tax=Novosphingopyxis baekryungensis TaxID=279369 RepID=UPI0003B4D401|nr:serine hydrolase domain-containing protein [Novosphingopyxis baekryungensis]
MKYITAFGALAALSMGGCAPVSTTDLASASTSAPTLASSKADTLILSPEEMARVQKAGAEILFWSDEQRSANFRRMEDIFPGTTAKASPKPLVLPKGAPLAMDDAAVTTFMQVQQVAGLMVIKDGKIVLERYGLGLKPTDRWTSFSVAKSFTSTLVGAAIRDGKIGSLQDPVTAYIPELGGSGYDGVTIEQLLSMTSGVAWNEDYTDPQSDVVKMLSIPVGAGQDPVTAYMKTLKREYAPGTHWEYKTGETNLIGTLVSRATGERLSDYAKRKIVDPAGFAGDLFWMVDSATNNIGGCCLSLRLSDYARMGLFAMDGGKGQVPDGWFAAAGSSQADTGIAGLGYGYQWWVYPGGNYGAQGIFGQAITIFPEQNVVIAAVSNWPVASSRKLTAERLAFFQKLAAGTR